MKRSKEREKELGDEKKVCGGMGRIILNHVQVSYGKSFQLTMAPMKPKLGVDIDGMQKFSTHTLP